MFAYFCTLSPTLSYFFSTMRFGLTLGVGGAIYYFTRHYSTVQCSVYRGGKQVAGLPITRGTAQPIRTASVAPKAQSEARPLL